MSYFILNIIACIEGNIILYIEYLFFVKFKKFGFLLFLCHCHLSIFNRSHWKKIWIIFKIKLYVGGELALFLCGLLMVGLVQFLSFLLLRTAGIVDSFYFSPDLGRSLNLFLGPIFGLESSSLHAKQFHLIISLFKNVNIKLNIY